MPGKHHRQQTAAAAPASPTTKPTAKYTNKDGSKFITVPKANATNDSSFPSPTAASGAKGQPAAEEPSTNGARQPVNRKKQKRREKLAAKLAAEQEASGHMHENGLPSPPASHEHHAADADADDSEDDAHEYLRNHARHLQEHGFSGDSESKKKSKKKKKKAGPGGDHEHANTRDPRSAPAPTERRGPGISKEKIWNTSSAEERERIKQFWLGLGEDERKSLVKVEKDAVLKKMKEQQRHTCSCTVCGRKRTAIEEELEGLYDAYYQELEHYANQGGQGEPPMMGSNRPLNSLAGVPSHSLSANYTNHRPSHGRIVEQLGDEDEEDDDDDEDEDDYSDDDDELEVVGDDDYSEELSEQSTRNSYANDFFNFGASLTVQGGILTVADDLLKNDGKKFIEMMEQLAERRMQREEDASKQFERGYNHSNGERYAHHPPPEDEEYDEEDDEYEEEEEDDYDSGDGEDNMTEEQRMEEGRRMFQIFAARMFEQRVLTAYREKVAKERQQKLLEELEDESKQESQRKAKRAKEAEKRKAKAQKKREKEAALKEQRDREKAEEEAQQEAEKARKAEEQRIKAEEKRKKKEALKKAEEEERRRKESERQRKAQQQLDTERKSREAKEIKEREKKARDELARQQDKELQERKEREARERKEQHEREKREKEAKAKAERAEREAREKKKQEDRAAHKAAVLAAQPAITLAKRAAPQSVPAAVPALPHHPSNPSVAPPLVPITTPAMPKGPTSSIRARQGSQHGPVAVAAQVPAHAHHHQLSYPATPTRPSPGLTVATGKSGSSSAQSGQGGPLGPRNTTSPLNATAKSFSNPAPAPIFPMQPFTQGMQPQPPPGFGPRLSNDASFPPMVPSGYRRSPPGIMTTMPPGLNGPAGGGRGLVLPLVPGAGPPPGFGFSPSLEAPGANSQLFGSLPGPQEAGAPSHVRKQSTGFEASSTSASAHPIGRLQPIGRPSSVVQGHQPPSRSPSHATLSSTDNTDDRRLGSSALLADSDDALEDFASNRRGTTAAPGPRTAAASGFSFGPDALFPNSHNPWAATASSGFGPSPPPGFQVPMSGATMSTGWGPNTPSKAVFGAPPGLGRSLDPRSVALRKYLCRACEELGGAVDPSVAADPVSPGSRGPEKFVPIEAVKAKVDQLCQGTHQMVHEKELLDLCETEGNETNGGGSFEMREDKATRTRSILWVPDAGPPGQRHNRVVGGLGEIGSPVFGQPGFPQRPSR